MRKKWIVLSINRTTCKQEKPGKDLHRQQKKYTFVKF